MFLKANDKVFNEDYLIEAEGYGVSVDILILAKEAILLNDELLL